MFHALLQQPPVGFQLGFARAAQADGTAALALQMGPAAHQPGGHVACSCASSTCSLPSWLRARWAKMSRIRPVRSTTRRSSALLQVALLDRRQRVVDQHQVGAGGLAGGPHFLQLAAADQDRRIRLVDRAPAAWPARGHRPTAPVRRIPPARLRPAVRRRGAGSAARFHRRASVRTIGSASGRKCGRRPAFASPRRDRISRRRPAAARARRHRRIRHRARPGARCAPAPRWRSRACRPSG